MNLQPKEQLTDEEVQRGLRFVIGDGLAAEAMTVLVGGAFLVAMALLMGASNFEIGLLAALPTFTNIFQLISIWLVRRYNNRRAIAVICSLLARAPLLAVGSLLLLFPATTSVEVLIFFLCFYYLFGSIAGPSWNSWMKDLVPEKMLGSYFSRRSRLSQTLNALLSIAVALLLDYIKKHYPSYQLAAYAGMFAAAGIIGITGAFILSRAPEPRGILLNENIFRLIKHPLKDSNFRRLLVFNSAWVFALNIATPFFTVFLLKSLGIPLSYVILLGIITQVGSILTVRLWGTFADRYSNKTIIAICGPLYIGCFIAWCFVGIYTHMYINLALLVLIYIFTGISTSGINLSLINIGLKLAPRAESIVYLSTKNIITAFFSSTAPLVGGYLADFFLNRHLNVRVEWGGPRFSRVFRLLELHEWNFLFLIAALLAFIALELLMQVKEAGEMEADDVRRILRKSVRGNLKEYFLIGHLLGWQQQLWSIIKKRLAP
ncbi:MFS transporter [Compostibacter hankyongensis]|uniref:MFS transporter n=1 Tax=Compostibacter hankyongensis TaxID=1007089 RepID=A0ABP8FWC8_9BACT